MHKFMNHIIEDLLDTAIEETESLQLSIYSAHDSTIIALLCALGLQERSLIPERFVSFHHF